MTLLLGEVVALLVAAALWLLAAVAMAVAAASLVAAVARRRPTPREMRFAVIGGLVVAGLAGRFHASDPLEVVLLRRPLPVLWLLMGAVGGVVLARVARRSTQQL
jgi:hypothetical protein